MRDADLWRIAKAIFDQEWQDYCIEYPESSTDGYWEADKDHYFEIADEYCRAVKSLGYTAIV